MNHDIFLRAHTGPPRKARPRSANHPKWPEWVLVFDTETSIDTRQDLTFGAYRLCQLQGDTYICAEEGFFCADDLDARQGALLDNYARTEQAEIAVKSFPPRLNLKLYSRSAFVEKVFWKAIRKGAMIVGFNLPFDLSRIAVDWRKADDGGWSLILSLRQSRKTGNLEPNPDRPRIRVASKDSKTAFISLTRPRIPEEWPDSSRFLDLHTLALALLGESYSLDALCEFLHITQKLDHTPTGEVSCAEIQYCRHDVRITVNVLNAMKREFDQHPIQLHPDRAYSPASIAKAYLDAMGVVPPKDKFSVPDRILGIAMEAYYGGRAECRIRRTQVPVVHTDFTSQYPTVNALLDNWKVLTAKSLSFEDATEEVRELVRTITLEDAFSPDLWKTLGFFAQVRPDKDVFPVRAVYNDQTLNIGVNELTSDRPLWVAGPDVVAAILLGRKAPDIRKAIRIIPHGKQVGLRATNLRGMVTIDPRKQDFFRYAVEQRKRPESDKALRAFLKLLANSGSYGLFVEITSEKRHRPETITVWKGDTSEQQPSLIVETQGRWYFPPLGALITAGGRLLLAMLERCVTDIGGTYLFCDTDSLCIVASEHGGPVECEHDNGQRTIHALSWGEVRNIAERFRRLNPYDPASVPDLLKIEDINYVDSDPSEPQRQLYGYAISAKRYVLFERTGNDLTIVDPKAHGLGYLYPPRERKGKTDPDWTFEAWEWLLRQELKLTATPPAWLNLPAMMRIVLSTPHVLDRLNHQTRPYNFVLCPMIDTVAGYPANVERDRFTLITTFETNRERWLHGDCINIHDGKVYRLALQQTTKLDKAIPQTFGYVLQVYTRHPEYKSLAPDGSPCTADTRGLLQRASIAAGEYHYIGKETDKRWEQGEDLSLLGFTPVQYQGAERTMAADTKVRDEIAKHGLREMMRKTGLSQHTLERILCGEPVRRATLHRVMRGLSHAGRDPKTRAKGAPSRDGGSPNV